MLYCTYDEYQAAGGTVPEAAFLVLCSRASRLIDSATFGRAEAHAAGCEDCRQMLADALETLTGREREIITLRFGLGGRREHTQKEVADHMGISQSYISRLEKRIIRRLRREILRVSQVP